MRAAVRRLRETLVTRGRRSRWLLIVPTQGVPLGPISGRGAARARREVEPVGLIPARRSRQTFERHWFPLRPSATDRQKQATERESVRRQDKADQIGLILDDLYPDPPIPLDHSDPYTLLVAVALSAQTTDKKVNEVTPALFAQASTPEEMARLDPDQIRELIREIGLAPTKARNLSTMAHQIIEAGGEVVADWDFLESLAGVGHKTASVVMSQAFGFPAFPVDTHIHRLAARWGLSDGRTVEKTERDLKAVFPEETWNRRHLQIIYFGREYCPARNHDLAVCPICSWAASKKRIAEESKSQRSKRVT